ncbi:MAG: hypothetical protein M0T81_01390 [Thermoplasmatales archaeon]|nr:hypothetical protein [Thermoplasmatales archaeon]
MDKKQEVGETAKGMFEEVELAFDLQQYILHSKDAKVSKKLYEKIVSFAPDTLLSVTKKIQSPLEIISVKEVDNEFIKTAFPSVKF